MLYRVERLVLELGKGVERLVQAGEQPGLGQQHARVGRRQGAAECPLVVHHRDRADVVFPQVLVLVVTASGKKRGC